MPAIANKFCTSTKRAPEASLTTGSSTDVPSESDSVAVKAVCIVGFLASATSRASSQLPSAGPCATSTGVVPFSSSRASCALMLDVSVS
eukprot:6334877-Pyramimonas_sp.AAC.1